MHRDDDRSRARRSGSNRASVREHRAASTGDQTRSEQGASQQALDVASCFELLLECERPLAGPERHRISGVDRLRVGRGASRATRFERGVLELQVPDGWMSSRHAELRRDSDGWQLVDLDSKNGSLVNGARVQAARIGDGDLIQLAHTFFRFHAAQQIVGSMASIARGTGGVLTTLSPVFAAVISTAAAVARTRVAVLVRGETGTGKEVLARAIHDLSGRSGAFVAINCGAIATNLVESELFGYRKGSFSGALHDHPGLVRSSHGGTLFLDEIGDLPSSAQAALLRVLQESEVMPVGGLRPELVNLRVVAATHRDLDDLVAQGAFRRDLLARLDGVTLDVPPLRDRREDVPLVIASLLHRLAPERYDVTFTPDAARALLDHTWPHNVRELEQALAGALAVSGVGAIARRHLPRALREATESVAQRELTGEERRHRDGLIEILRDHRGNLSAVARAMGKGRTQVVRWLERYGLDADEFRTD